MLLICINYLYWLQKTHIMDELIELLKVLLPAVIILIVVYFMMREFTKLNSRQIKFLQDEQSLQKLKLNNDLRSNSQKISIPLKFQAHERMALFLERITPSNLIPRVLKPSMNVERLHAQLLAIIREEYEHNMSQQLYVSNQSWDLVRNAKEELVSIINTSASKFNKDDKINDYSKEIIIEYSKLNNPIDKALFSLKEEIHKHFA